MFIQTRNGVLELSQSTAKPTFDDFCKGLINEQERLIASGQVSPSKAIMEHNKNPKKILNNYKGSYSHTSNHAKNNGHVSHAHHETSKRKKVYEPCKRCGKTNHPQKNCFKEKNLIAKAIKKNSNESQVALCASIVSSSNSSSNLEWIMDSGASKHIPSNVSLFKSYYTNKNSSKKISIGDGKKLSAIGSGNINVANVNLEDVFHFQNMPINLLSIYHACQKGLKFESWPNKYVLKDIN